MPLMVVDHCEHATLHIMVANLLVTLIMRAMMMMMMKSRVRHHFEVSGERVLVRRSGRSTLSTKLPRRSTCSVLMAQRGHAEL